MKELQKRIEGKKSEAICLQSLAEELKQGLHESDNHYLNKELTDLDNTIATLTKSCAKHQQQLEEGLRCSNNFYEKLQRATASLNEKKERLEKVSSTHSDTHSLKDELNVNLI